MNPRILFILKYRDGYGDTYDQDVTYDHGVYGLSSGLLNSARFIVDMLAGEGVHVKLVQVTDNNDIDREVHKYQPTHVVIEALWVVPEKFDVLQRLHPHVRWIIRGHSDIPFFAVEGIAMDWLTHYVQFANVRLALNNDVTLHDVRGIIQSANPGWSEAALKEKVILLPNFYPYFHKYRLLKKEDEFLDVACFGAIRPLKNQLIQAVAAIRYAEKEDKILRFHINGTRPEQGGGNVLKNLRSLFATMPTHTLVEHDWLTHKNFLELLTHMDMALQVSFSESFNIVAADSVVIGLPAVVSSEIAWVAPWLQAEPTNSVDIFNKMVLARDPRYRRVFKILNSIGLRDCCERNKHYWLRYFDIS